MELARPLVNPYDYWQFLGIGTSYADPDLCSFPVPGHAHRARTISPYRTKSIEILAIMQECAWGVRQPRDS